ncbi:MAG TPA: DUF4386 domain-containing protein [Pyrinomonadaceae bacterium]|nr:DUF4386 domain-containing protein [Pyrinomonadaceae bacterium]
MSSKLNKITAATLIFLGIYINIPFSILGVIFDYPNILRQPTGQVLTMFKQGGSTLIATWYAFAIAALLMIVVAKLIQQILQDEHKHLTSIATTFGVLAGVSQVLGLIRWVFVVPMLADAYTDSNSSEATKSAAVMVFQGFHQYAGVAIGEHLGQLFTALWIVLISAAMLNSTIFRRWQGFVGIAISAMMLLGLVEGFATVITFNVGIFGVLTPIAFILLSIWMISLGVSLIWRKSKS